MNLKSALLLAIGPCLMLRGAHAENVFTDVERAKIATYWNEPGRYSVSAPPEAAKTGPWQIRLTTEASIWFLAYQKAVGAARTPPTMDAAATSPDTKSWEDWVKAKVAYDRWFAQRTADAANTQVIGSSYKPLAAPETPATPGHIPPSLLAAAGNPPPFAAAVTPLQYTVEFGPGETYTFQDNVPMRPRFAYYRFSKGTVAYGTPLKEMDPEELRGLYEAAGFNASEQRVMGAVSKLEGGFDAVNTYDTGCVSIGFLQFITFDHGHGSLIEVLQRERADDAEAYNADFRNLGVDVDSTGVIVVVDPGTGTELAGREAVLKAIEDKRFAAIFQRAGKRSRAFRLAQIKVAKTHYWPMDDPIKITVAGQTVEGKVSDVIKSEAGMATLFDRKVNRGSIEPITDVVGRIMADHNLTTLSAASDYEREIIQALKYRTDFLKDQTLSQPK